MIVMVAGLGLYNYTTRHYIEKSDFIVEYNNEWNPIVASVVNKHTFAVMIDGEQYNSSSNSLYMDRERNIMMDASLVKDAFNCAINLYDETYVKIAKGTDVLTMEIGKKEYDINGEKVEIESVTKYINEKTYVPIKVLCDNFKYSFSWDGMLNTATVNNDNTNKRLLPYRYSYVDEKRVPSVKNQGLYGTCWAFASLTALESTLMPEEKLDFSEDHMSMNNSYNISQNDGGDYNMAIAYLTSWQGPVMEEDDPYGDGQTNPELQAVKHVQEVQILEGRNLESIKEMVFKYGGVESAIYMAGETDTLAYSGYYNDIENAYCYIGTQKPNHDVVIIGWDDNYSRDNFMIKPEGDGAFICRNSWGEEFGDNGTFYVSYYDANLGVHSVVYTKVENIRNYDNIYQSDLCGMVGLLGYGREEAYFANVYTAKSDEEIKAVGMYATGKDTEYSIYVIPEFEDVSSLNRRNEPNATGTLTNAGYYTIPVSGKINIKKGQKYAVVVKIRTPNANKPVAVEYVSNYQTKKVDLSDGEGYISLRGIDWENTEKNQKCNICLKVYTNKHK